MVEVQLKLRQDSGTGMIGSRSWSLCRRGGGEATACLQVVGAPELSCGLKTVA